MTNECDDSVGRTANGHPVPGGFTGTIPAFLQWLADRLEYGGVVIGEPKPDQFGTGRLVREVRTITGGWSDDEALLGRVSRDSAFSIFWELSARGGLSVYIVPAEAFDSPDETTWLDEPTDVIAQLPSVRALVVEVDGKRTPFDLPRGARIRLTGSGEGVSVPSQVLTIQAAADVPTPAGADASSVEDVLDEITNQPDRALSITDVPAAPRGAASEDFDHLADAGPDAEDS